MASSPQHEPTMEEILASIRKIISEDSTEAAPAEPAPVAAAPAAAAPAPTPITPPAPQVVVEEDVLELTEEVQEPAPTAAAPADEIVFQTIEEPAPAVSGSDIFSDKTRAAIDNAFNKLDSEEEAAAKPAPSPMASTFRSTTGDGNCVYSFC